MRKILAAIGLWLALAAAAPAQIVGALPFTLQNGSVADANQVMANFTAIVTGVNTNAANAGANSNITALLGLTTPLAYSAGGSSVYIGGTGSNVGNAYVVAAPVPSGFTLTTGKIVSFIAPATNNGAATLNTASTGVTNFFRQTPTGPAAMVGGEIVINQVVLAYYDGTQYECLNCANPSLVPAGTVVDFLGVNIPSGWAFASGQAISRTAFVNLFNTITLPSVSATTTNGSAVISTTLASSFQVGWFVGGANITCNSQVVSIGVNTVTINNPAGASGATTLSTGPAGQGDCSTTFNVPNLTGRTTAGVDGISNITSATCTNAGTLGSPCGAQTITLVTGNLPPYTPAGTITNGAITFPTSAIASTAGGGSAAVTTGPFSSNTSLTGALVPSQATSTFTGTAQNGTSTPFSKLMPVMLVYKIIKL